MPIILTPTLTGSITLTASRIIRNALKMIGVIAGSEEPTHDQASDGLDRLNRMIDSWGIQRGTIQGVSRSTYPLVANQGGPTNPYVIGVSLQFNQTRPIWIDQAAIVYGTGTSATELPLYICRSADEYAAIIQKNITSPIPTVLFYDGISTGNIFLWPVASSASQSIVLYVPVAVSKFADYNTSSYTLMTGYQLAMESNLALQLIPEYPRDGYQVDPMLVKMASESLAYIKRMNLDPGLLQADVALQPSGGYAPGAPNWLVGP